MQEFFNDSPLWLSSQLVEVNWDHILEKTLPFLDEEGRELVMDRSGFKSINPLLIVTDLVVEHMSDASSISFSKFDIFKQKIGKRIDEWSNLLQKYDDRSIGGRVFTDSLKSKASAIKKLFKEKSDQVKSFLEKYKELLIEHVKPKLKPIVEFNSENPGNFSMTWPWLEGEAWRVGGTHYTTRNIPSALDVAESRGVCRWKYDHTCVEPSTPKVTAMHSGIVTRFSRCNTRITHSTGWATNYYHMDHLIHQSLETVKQGDAIGQYADRYNNSICEGGRSYNAHLHFDFIDPSGRHQNLDGWEINGYKVHAGAKNYDTDCDRCYLEKKGIKYCPYRGTVKHEKWWWTTKIVNF